MKRILFVCLGNICRSPLAEGIMLHLKSKHDLKIEIDSAGTAPYHIGEAPDKRTIANAKKNSVDLTELRARQFKTTDFDEFDNILVMDLNNLKNVLALAKNNDQKQKVQLFLDTLHPGKSMEVPDPYYDNDAKFEEVFQLIYKTCQNLRLNIVS